MKRLVPLVLRVLLALIFLGANVAAIMANMQPPPGYPPEAWALQEALQKSGYITLEIMVIQVVAGALLLLNLWTPLMLVVLAPITINILLFHLFMTPKVMFTVGGLGVLVFVLNMALLWIHREHYRNLLVRRTTP